jgi:hypothetical protein
VKRLAVTVFLLAITGCASASLTAFRDPAFSNRTFEKIAVFAAGMYLENALVVEQQVCERLEPAPCVSGKKVLPPTRAYSVDEVSRYLTEANIDGVLIVALADDQSASQYIGTVASSSTTASGTQSGAVNLYRNGLRWTSTSQASASTTSTATPVYDYRRTAHAVVGLFDRESGNIAWRGELRVSGQGYVNVSDAAFISAATKELAFELKAAQLVR